MAYDICTCIVLVALIAAWCFNRWLNKYYGDD